MNPTPAQIEAADRIEDRLLRLSEADGLKHLPLKEAANEIKRLRAAQVKPTVKEFLQDPVSTLNHAAQVGEQGDPAWNAYEAGRKDGLAWIAHETKLRTIQRCAQVAENHLTGSSAWWLGKEIAAAIRKLKDET